MRESSGNIWDFHEQGNWICITTNGSVRKDGLAVIGRGVALQAVKRIPALQSTLGKRLLSHRNHLHIFDSMKIITFTVKREWNDGIADLTLIQRSAEELVRRWRHKISPDLVYLPRPGCGNGNLFWAQVRPMLNQILGRDFIVVSYDQGS